MQKKNNIKKPGGYTVVLVSENEKRSVRQFHLSAGLLTAICVSVAALFIFMAGALFYQGIILEEESERIEELNAKLEGVSSLNIVLKADYEQSLSELREARQALDTQDYMQKQMNTAEALNYIPSGLPVGGQVAKPSAYDSSARCIKFTVGDGAKIISSAAGTVESIVQDPSGGVTVTLNHGNDYKTMYTYRGFPLVTEGTKLNRGTTIYIADSLSADFIYQVTYKEEYIDPGTIIKIDG